VSLRFKALEETHAAKQETDKRLKAVWDDIQSLLVEYDVSLIKIGAKCYKFIFPTFYNRCLKKLKSQTKITPLRTEFQDLRKKDDVVVATIDAQFSKMYKIQVC